ncbi:MAG: HD-GYP domain-containing protein [Hahellaceae bacterium]|jgi:HD-GYP domain-containing protein (c-di-GMP phosphodiesterase class II)|nr:HD-GYP domain-containing protein [Hahellaceae bacterium]MCP5210091.1 HD-GYP domain-containing protein [Hahellaceae bacterium]
MIKRIPVSALRVGMYISDLNKDWIPHNNMKKSGPLKSEAVIEKIIKLGVTEIYIDTMKGADTQDGIPAHEVEKNNETQLQKAGALSPLTRPQISLQDEMIVAEKLHREAKGLVNNVMEDVKIGKSIDVSSVSELADGMLDSIFRNHNALSCLGRIREKDSYLMEHSVNLSVLMSLFGRSMSLDRDILHQTIIGALLHDIGKILVPDEVLHKPGKLTDAEFGQMKTHVVHSADILKTTEGISELTILVAAQHHEKMDGSGYPNGLKGEEISAYGRMVAITDVYDAITADRVYHKGMTPTAAIKKLLEWSGSHLDRSLVEHFIRTVGIFPVGSLVLLESGRLGVVIEANEADQRLPTVRVMYHTKFRNFIKTMVIDLSKPSVQDRILKAVDPEAYKISVKDFL